MMRTISLLVLIVLMVLACEIHLVPDGPLYREYPDGSSERSTSVAVYSGKTGDTLDRAQHLASKGQYEKAIALYNSVYRDSTNEDKFREDALFHMGSLHANFFNEAKNYHQALKELRRLLDEFPETEFRARAEKRIAEIERTMEN